MGARILELPAEAPSTFEDFLESESQKDLLRFTTAGSVDDGKSTLIGRLLYDSRSVYDDHLESVTRASVGRNAGAIDFSLLTDGLRAEREQGITIDVAYRYFATPKRKFIIADTPGHEQYTRNMVTGASTAELAVVLVDARKGVLPQSRRHAYISSLLGLSQLVIAVNKMDLVGYDQHVFAHIETEFRRFLSAFHGIETYFVPMSALAGDNVVVRGGNMPWFHGPSLLEYLEQVPVGRRAQTMPFRFAVQRVVRPNLDFRGYAGTVATGSVRAGDTVAVFPSGRTSEVSRIVTFDGDLKEAVAGQAVTLTLADEIDISRGDVIASIGNPPSQAAAIEATLVWLNEQPAEAGKRYRLKQGATLQWADLDQIEYRTNINTLDREEGRTLEMNAIGAVRLVAARPLVFDSYTRNRITGSLILIDPATNATVAAGMIAGASVPATTGAPPRREKGVAGIESDARPVTAEERTRRRGHTGARIELGGSEDIAGSVERFLFDRGCTVFRGDSETEEVRNALERLGALVVVAGSRERGAFVATGGTRHPVTNASVRLIGDLLIATKVFRTADWVDGGGL